MSGNRARILAVDDEPSVGRAIQRLLGGVHDVEITTDPRVALARIRDGERFDVILCDLMMPRMTGMDLHAELVSRGRHEADRVVFLTGGAFTNRAREFLDRTPNRWLEKPFDASTLRRTVGEVLRSAHEDGDGGGGDGSPVARAGGLQQPG